MKARAISKKARLPQGSARDRLLTAAESLFAEFGLDGVSFRDLVAAAGVSLSSAHYYFESKQEILAEVFGRRAKTMTDRRSELLGGALARKPDLPDIREIVRAFVQPSFEITHGDRDNVVNRLLARLAAERSSAFHAIVSDAFIDNDRLFLDALTRAAPHLDVANVRWRFHLLTGAMIYTMSGSGHLERMSDHESSHTDWESAVEAIVDGFAAMFSSPPTKLPPRLRTADQPSHVVAARGVEAH